MIKEGDPKPWKFSAPSKSDAVSVKKPRLVFLPGFNETPVRGAPDGILPPEVLRTYKEHWDVHFRIFDLSDEADTAAYERLMTAAASNAWVRVFKELTPESVGQDGNWKIGVKWGEKFLEPPETGVFVMTEDTVGVIP